MYLVSVSRGLDFHPDYTSPALRPPRRSNITAMDVLILSLCGGQQELRILIQWSIRAGGDLQVSDLPGSHRIQERVYVLALLRGSCLNKRV